MFTVEEYIRQAKNLGASDVHLIPGIPVKIRLDGQLRNLNENVLTPEESEECAKWFAGKQYDTMAEIGELDLSGTYCDTRCRVHLFRQMTGVSLAIRLLQDRIPELDSLGLPAAASKLPELHKGIVLVTGETGSGKSTTLAAFLNQINHTRRNHIVTLEDPIEYVHTPDLCAINQREVGRDTKSFAEGLKASLREDPDVILIGEMRDRDTIETAITAAETGHLVFATLHTNSAADSIDRMVQVFPGDMQQQIRMELSMALQAVLTQQLIPSETGGRSLCCELMIVNNAIRNLIREGKTPQISNQISISADLGGQTMDQALTKLVRERKISRKTAQEYGRDPEYWKNFR